MTRETKIGLLVGLAFVIMTGILLSNYLSSTNEPGSAPLKVAGDSLRSGLGEVGSDDVAPMLRAPATVTPSQPVVINAELNHHAQQSSGQPPVRFVEPAPPHGNAITPVAPVNPGNTIAERLRQAAAARGEELEVVDPNNAMVVPPTPVNPPVVVDPPTPSQPVKTASRSYQAQAGDSLGVIAQKMYGSGCKANRDAIVAANPSLAQNRDLIVAGRTYVIPAISKGAVGIAPPSKSTEAPAVEPTTVEKTIWYVVQPHDTLWSIAMNEVGTPSAVAAIEDLNKNTLNGNEALRPNMKLKLPKKAE